MPNQRSLNGNQFPHVPDRISGLVEIAENLWWSWHPQARMLFKMLDRQIWKDSHHNPDRMLRSISPQALQEATRDANYLRHYDLVMSQFAKCIYKLSTPVHIDPCDQSIKPIAYFSAEYGLHHSLPFYAGGLGFLAGDHLKECSDMGVPLVAVGFMYPSGYLHQQIGDDGWQQDFTQEFDRDSTAVNRVLDSQGRQLVINIPCILYPSIHIAIWKVSVGRISLYLMDPDIEQNEPWIRQISDRLYTSDPEQRLLQEIILGIGGSKVLDTLGINYSMLHLNEGHASFALLERLRSSLSQENDFEAAAEQVRRTSLFTTHTPVPAGHDVFPFELMRKYFSSYWQDLGLNEEEFFELGRNPDHPHAGFNMTVLALKLSGYHNGVSKKHGQVSRDMWQSLWPDTSPENIPIRHVTNGVHLPTWIEPKFKLLLNRYFGEEWMQEHDNPAVWEFIEEVPDRELWQTHYWHKMKLINYIRYLARERWKTASVDPSLLVAMGTLLDPTVLTIGFARRFATYKRAELLFRDKDRLKTLVRDPWRPVQFIFAGKAHPSDHGGKEIIQRIFNRARDPELGGRVAFVENYNEQLAQYMVHGVDVWLNNPLPPMEASGTSGMKAALNGVPQLSIADGWWLEGSDGQNGWTFGNGDEPVENRDERDAEDLYRIIGEEIVPRYYDVNENGTPKQWVRIMKNSIKSNAPKFSARRMVKDYIRQFYSKVLPIF